MLALRDKTLKETNISNHKIQFADTGELSHQSKPPYVIYSQPCFCNTVTEDKVFLYRQRRKFCASFYGGFV